MTDRATSIVRSWLTRAWLWIAFVVGLLPLAAYNRLIGGGDFSGPEPAATSYWLRRSPIADEFDIRSNDDMIVRITPGSQFGNHLSSTTSRRGSRRLAGALCLAVLRPISAIAKEEEEAHLDPSIYAMY